jgi:hypothetical protein
MMEAAGQQVATLHHFDLSSFDFETYGDVGGCVVRMVSSLQHCHCKCFVTRHMYLYNEIGKSCDDCRWQRLCKEGCKE